MQPHVALPAANERLELLPLAHRFLLHLPRFTELVLERLAPLAQCTHLLAR